jgi:hypothetical protein
MPDVPQKGTLLKCRGLAAAPSPAATSREESREAGRAGKRDRAREGDDRFIDHILSYDLGIVKKSPLEKE